MKISDLGQTENKLHALYMCLNLHHVFLGPGSTTGDAGGARWLFRVEEMEVEIGGDQGGWRSQDRLLERS